MPDLWLLQYSDDEAHRVARLDESGAVIATITLDPAPMRHDSAQLASGADAVWIAAGHAMLYRVDERGIRSIDLSRHLDGFAVTDDAVWIATGRDLYRIDPQGVRIDAEIPHAARHLTVGAGAVWTTWTKSVTRVDAATMEVGAPIALDGFINELAFAAGALWLVTLVATEPDERSTLWRLDPATLATTAIATLPGRPSLFATETALWLCPHDGIAQRFDLADLTLAACAALGFVPAIAVGEHLWGLQVAAGDRWTGGGHVTSYHLATGEVRRLGAARGHGLAPAR
jgi:hypothetical protein